ncbi:MAG TPA: serine/threonine-protein kinase [Kofleriaceae bacterium]|jgi:hypothetical protein|nr:serine/threonine-protein kinase [Kofleriaceae bacterium]
MTACPDDDALIALVEHALDPAALASLEGHVDGCARCRATIGHLAAIDDGDAPRTVGRYRLERLLGEGGMGVVWRAWDPMLERPVAIKLLRGEHGSGARLLREGRALAKLAHPNVIAVHDVGEYDGEVFVATELVEGEPMHKWQAERDAGSIVRAYAQAARGLAAAHALGLVHRDVKPSNIFVGKDGRVRVGDFGLVVGDSSAATDDTMTASGAVVGTPAYMAPEQREGRATTARSDQFSLCLALAEALIGARPPADASVAMLAAGSAAAAPWSAIARGLARDPNARFADMTALADALEGAPRAPRGRVLAIGGALVALVVAGAIGGWAILSHGTGRAQTVPSAHDVGTAVRASIAAAEAHDPDACFAAVDQLDALGESIAPTAAMQRGVCEMMAGRCDDGRARIEDALDAMGAARDASFQVKMWCPIDGDLDRAWTQAVAHENVAYCAAIEADVRRVATRPTTSNLDRERAAQAVGNLGRCYALAHRCDDANRNWTLAAQIRGAEIGHISCAPR